MDLDPFNRSGRGRGRWGGAERGGEPEKRAREGHGRRQQRSRERPAFVFYMKWIMPCLIRHLRLPEDPLLRVINERKPPAVAQTVHRKIHRFDDDERDDVMMPS